MVAVRLDRSEEKVVFIYDIEEDELTYTGPAQYTKKMLIQLKVFIRNGLTKYETDKLLYRRLRRNGHVKGKRSAGDLAALIVNKPSPTVETMKELLPDMMDAVYYSGEARLKIAGKWQTQPEGWPESVRLVPPGNYIYDNGQKRKTRLADLKPMYEFLRNKLLEMQKLEGTEQTVHVEAVKPCDTDKTSDCKKPILNENKTNQNITIKRQQVDYPTNRHDIVKKRKLLPDSSHEAQNTSGFARGAALQDAYLPATIERFQEKLENNTEIKQAITIENNACDVMEVDFESQSGGEAVKNVSSPTNCDAEEYSVFDDMTMSNDPESEVADTATTFSVTERSERVGLQVETQKHNNVSIKPEEYMEKLGGSSSLEKNVNNLNAIKEKKHWISNNIVYNANNLINSSSINTEFYSSGHEKETISLNPENKSTTTATNGMVQATSLKNGEKIGYLDPSQRDLLTGQQSDSLINIAIPQVIFMSTEKDGPVLVSNSAVKNAGVLQANSDVMVFQNSIDIANRNADITLDLTSEKRGMMTMTPSEESETLKLCSELSQDSSTPKSVAALNVDFHFEEGIEMFKADHSAHETCDKSNKSNNVDEKSVPAENLNSASRFVTNEHRLTANILRDSTSNSGAELEEKVSKHYLKDPSSCPTPTNITTTTVVKTPDITPASGLQKPSTSGTGDAELLLYLSHSHRHNNSSSDTANQSQQTTEDRKSNVEENDEEEQWRDLLNRKLRGGAPSTPPSRYPKITSSNQELMVGSPTAASHHLLPGFSQAAALSMRPSTSRTADAKRSHLHLSR